MTWQTAVVWRDGGRVGRIERSIHGARFAYDADYLQQQSKGAPGIAFHLPLRSAAFETVGVNLHTFFANLLPEGLRLQVLQKARKTSADDLLTLLLAAGSDCIGDVVALPEGQPWVETAPLVDVPRSAHLSFAQLSFAELLQQSLEYDGLHPERHLIAGAQPKISAGAIRVSLRARVSGKAYLLKLQPEALPHLVDNEHFFMRLAAACGLAVAKTTIRIDRHGAKGLLVERFDRRPIKGGAVQRVHQEDACQVVDRYPADKYNLSHSDIAAAWAERCTAPVVEVAKLMRLMAFSYLIANGDLHAKNLSLRRDQPSGRVEMTPAYDLLSTLPYGDARMALRLDGRDDNWRRRHFVAFGERFAVRPAATTAMLDELLRRATPWIDRVPEIGLEPRPTAHLQRVMRKRAAELAG